MAVNDLLPARSTREADPEPSVVNFDDAGDVLDVLCSETAREVLIALYDAPATTSELAREVDTSVQNAEYHLGRLEAAELIETSGVRYSTKGREMDVYAPTSAPLVVFTGDPDQRREMARALDDTATDCAPEA